MIRNRQLTALSNDAILGRAPSVFATKAGPGASDRYQFVSTIEVVDTMRSAGFHVVNASQSKSKTEDGRMFTRHALRLVHEDYMGGVSKVGDVVPQVVMTNSHNRTSAYALSAGLYRLVCMNGMMTPAAAFANIRVLHNDREMQKHVIEGIAAIRELSEATALPTIAKMQQLELSDSQVLQFAQAATLFKFGEVKADHTEGMLQVRRPEDEGRSLWTVLNRVQENAVRGGYMARDAANRNVTVRGIQSVDRDLDFNANLWSLAARIAA